MSGTLTPSKTIRDYTESTSPATSAAILIQPAAGPYLWTSIANLLTGYVLKATAATITAVHTFSPGSATAPFILGSNGQGQKVTGLNADLLDGKDETDIRRTRYASIATSSAIANTTTETIFDKNYTIPAGRLVAGSVVRIVAHGTYATTGTPVLTLRGRVGGVGGMNFGSASGTMAAVGTSGWNAVFVFALRAAGASGTAVPGYGAAGFVGSTDMLPSTVGATGTVNTTGTLSLVLTAQWGTASASNTINCTSIVVDIEDAVSTS